MASVIVYGRVVGVTVLGVGGHLVTVEAYVGRGLPSLIFTGLPGAAVNDARDRVRPAVESAGLEWPLRRVVVNLAPANLRKDGPGLDLPMAVGVLTATAQVPAASVVGYAFAGELSLKGELLPTPGIISVAIAAARAGLVGVVVPAANAVEAAQIDSLRVVGAATLTEVAGFLRGTWEPAPVEAEVAEVAEDPRSTCRRSWGRNRLAERSRWRPRADTTSSWSGLPARARPCWRAASPPSFRPSPGRRPWRPPSCIR